MASNPEQCTVPVCNWQNAFYVVLAALLLLVLVVSLHSRFCEFNPADKIAAPIFMTSNSDDTRWQVAVRDMSEAVMQRSETRLRDHFSLLLVLVGFVVTIILAGFSFIMNRRESRFLKDMERIKFEANTLLREARSDAEASLDRMRDYESEGKDIIAKTAAMCGRNGLNEKYYDAALSTTNKQEFVSTCHIQPTSEENQTCTSGMAEAAIQMSSEVNGQNVVPVMPEQNSICPTHVESGTIKTHDTSASTSIENCFQNCVNAAEQGDVKAQISLARMYTDGVNADQDAEKAAYWFMQAAKQGYVEAEYYLGLIYSLGRGIEQNDKEAVRWYKAAAEKGYDKAQCNLSNMYLTGRGVDANFFKAAEWVEKAAKQGNMIAQFNLGNMYRQGKGVEQNYAEASKWFRKAAEQGMMKAQWNLALMFEQGQGVEQNDTEAFYWFLKAAKRGESKAALRVSTYYADGRGVPENYTEAYTFLLLGKALITADNYSEMVIEAQKALKKTLSPEQIALAQEKAKVMWERIQAQKEVSARMP